jgi:hypothetical protein
MITNYYQDLFGIFNEKSKFQEVKSTNNFCENKVVKNSSYQFK